MSNLVIKPSGYTQGESIPWYFQEQPVRYDILSLEDQYVYILDENPKGEIRWIYPNVLSGENPMREGEIQRVVALGRGQRLNVSSQKGIGKIYVLTSNTEMNKEEAKEWILKNKDKVRIIYYEIY